MVITARKTVVGLRLKSKLQIESNEGSVNFKCSYCEEEGEVDLAPPRPCVVKCKRCRRILAVVSKEKKIPMLPFEDNTIVPTFLRDILGE